MTDSDDPNRGFAPDDPRSGGPHPGHTPSEPPTEQFGGQRAYSRTRPFEADVGNAYPATPEPASGPPTPPPGHEGTPTPPAPRRRRRWGLIAGVTTLVVVLLVVIAGVGSELYLRSRTEDCLKQSFSQVTGSSTSVSLSKKPMLLQFASRTVPYVQVDSSGGDGSAIELHGRAEDIHARPEGSTLGRLAATGTVPFARVVELSKQSGQQQNDSGQQNGGQQNGGTGLEGLFGGFTLDQVTGSQADGTISVDATVTLAIFPIPVSVQVKPVLTAGKLDFQVVKASALVFGVPADFAQSLVNGISRSLFPPLFDQLRFDRLDVTSTGVNFSVKGADVPLTTSTAGPSSGAQPQGACTIL